MLKICHFISGDLWAGAEVVAYHLLKGLKSYSDLALSAILLNEGRLADELRKIGIRIYVVDEGKTSFFHIFVAIRKILNRHVPDLIHSHRYKENILAYLISISFGEGKLIGTQHGLPEVNARKISLKQKVISKCNFFLLSHCFDKTVAVSHDIQRALIEQYRFKAEKVSVIRNGIETPEIPQKEQDGGTFVIGSSGRLFSIKDYPFMVEIAKAVVEKAINIRFKLAGDGPERTNIEAFIQDANLKNHFELCGHLDDISVFYRELDLYLNTSLHEGIPMSVLEAMSHKLPVIAPNVGGLGEIVDDGVQGFLLERRDPKAFARKCLSLYEDKALLRSMSQASLDKVVQEFSMENMAERYFKLYLDIAAKC